MLGVFVLTLLISGVLCDVYLHNPRGSNNRLNENTAERKNANRVFDSQNNNRGGYNVGDSGAGASGNNEGNQYRMKYFQSGAQYKTSGDGGGQSELMFEWTGQHGCGGNEDTDPHKQNCNLVLQFMCSEDAASATGQKAENLIRNGVQTTTQAYQRPPNLQQTQRQDNNRENRNVQTQRVLQENFDWYDRCYVRERNNGLFTADQVLQNNGLAYSSAIYTRQNPNGNRNGYECPEERDYYPYWHPSPWKDIAVLAQNASMCDYYQKRSFNVQPYHECLEYYTPGGNRRPYSRWNNEADCTDNGGSWTLLYNYLEKRELNREACLAQTSNEIRHIWEVPHDTTTGKEECLVALDAPDCYEAPWSRSNHLGNGREPKANMYKWILPHFPSDKTMRCVTRLRYNISTDDYDPYNTDSSHNEDNANGVVSPVQQNPSVEIAAGTSPLQLAINTAQFGRTFQDRSHVFKLMPRPANVQSQRIHNLNVRGKRGNIVQVYPAVEYDFVPNDLQMSANDLVHLQWTGSNTHNNNPPGGDGQTGDAGEGTGGTDRSNMVQISDLDENYPLPYERSTMWTNAQIMWTYDDDVKTAQDLAINVASSGYFKCMEGCTDRPGNKANMQVQLNNAPASYEGVLLKMSKGSYDYIGSRNNNFSNRSQKGKITVK